MQHCTVLVPDLRFAFRLRHRFDSWDDALEVMTMAQRQTSSSQFKRFAASFISVVKQRPFLVVLFLMVLLAGAAFGMSGFGKANRGTELIQRSRDVSDASEETEKKSDEEDLYVDVAGAVRSPGVVKLFDGDRIDDAISAAGGLSDDADVSQLNRASKVTDGLKVYVPKQGEQNEAVSSSSQEMQGSEAGLVSINSASQAELETLSGIGPSTAQAIIDDRSKNGPFAAIEDLMRVSGIGEKKFAKIKDAISL